MRLLVTGANGFLGRHVVRAALERGHDVRALIRPAADASVIGEASKRLEIARADLRSRRGLAERIEGTDAVIHLAAAKSGDLYAQLAGTVVATENLLAAMKASDVRRLVLASSFAVYDYRKLRRFARLAESSPLERRPEDRDAYAWTKLLQERLVRDAAGETGVEPTVLRPGVVFGPGEVWTARLGARIGRRWWLRTGSWARLPLTYVENCAEAFVLAAESDAAKDEVLNVVDAELPTQRRYARLLQRHSRPRPRIVPVPLWTLRVLALAAWATNRLFFGGRARIPQILRPAAIAARYKPLRYTSGKLRETLGWTPRYGLREAIARSFGEELRDRGRLGEGGAGEGSEPGAPGEPAGVELSGERREGGTS